MSFWDTPIREMAGTWFILGVLVTIVVQLVARLIRDIRVGKSDGSES